VVRLRRDNEGNFGYVYTADENAVAEAQQELEDAQNNLYNIGLEGANDYAEKYAETLQEMNDEITELTEMWQEGEIASKEEYQERVLALEDFYNQKLM
jgi:aspartate/tyrosine/aromatic aminotransferase